MVDEWLFNSNTVFANLQTRLAPCSGWDDKGCSIYTNEYPNKIRARVGRNRSLNLSHGVVPNYGASTSLLLELCMIEYTPQHDTVVKFLKFLPKTRYIL
jgi:hypothetical protein